MMVGAVMFAVAAFAVTNTPSSFSTMVERTLPCSFVSDPENHVGTVPIITWGLPPSPF